MVDKNLLHKPELSELCRVNSRTPPPEEVAFSFLDRMKAEGKKTKEEPVEAREREERASWAEGVATGKGSGLFPREGGGK